MEDLLREEIKEKGSAEGRAKLARMRLRRVFMCVHASLLPRKLTFKG